jgi:hypothetical protein
MRVGKHANSAEGKTWPLSIACERPRLEKGEKDAKTHRIVGRIWGRMRGIFGFWIGVYCVRINSPRCYEG